MCDVDSDEEDENFLNTQTIEPILIPVEKWAAKRVRERGFKKLIAKRVENFTHKYHPSYSGLIKIVPSVPSNLGDLQGKYSALVKYNRDDHDHSNDRFVVLELGVTPKTTFRTIVLDAFVSECGHFCLWPVIHGPTTEHPWNVRDMFFMPKLLPLTEVEEGKQPATITSFHEYGIRRYLLAGVVGNDLEETVKAYRKTFHDNNFEQDYTLSGTDSESKTNGKIRKVRPRGGRGRGGARGGVILVGNVRKPLSQINNENIDPAANQKKFRVNTTVVNNSKVKQGSKAGGKKKVEESPTTAIMDKSGELFKSPVGTAGTSGESSPPPGGESNKPTEKPAAARQLTGTSDNLGAAGTSGQSLAPPPAGHSTGHPQKPTEARPQLLKLVVDLGPQVSQPTSVDQQSGQFAVHEGAPVTQLTPVSEPDAEQPPENGEYLDLGGSGFAPNANDDYLEYSNGYGMLGYDVHGATATSDGFQLMPTKVIIVNGRQQDIGEGYVNVDEENNQEIPENTGDPEPIDGSQPGHSSDGSQDGTQQTVEQSQPGTSSDLLFLSAPFPSVSELRHLDNEQMIDLVQKQQLQLASMRTQCDFYRKQLAGIGSNSAISEKLNDIATKTALTKDILEQYMNRLTDSSSIDENPFLANELPWPTNSYGDFEKWHDRMDSNLYEDAADFLELAKNFLVKLIENIYNYNTKNRASFSTDAIPSDIRGQQNIDVGKHFGRLVLPFVCTPKCCYDFLKDEATSTKIGKQKRPLPTAAAGQPDERVNYLKNLPNVWNLFEEAATLFAIKQLHKDLPSKTLKESYGKRWHKGFFEQRAQLSLQFINELEGKKANRSGSKKKKSSTSPEGDK